MKVGILSMRTDAVKDVTDQNQYSVLRLKKELPNRTHIGGMYTALDHYGENGYLNKSYAIDAQLGIGELSKIVLFAGLTDSPGIESDNAYAYRIEAARDSKQISTVLSYTEVGKDFNPEMGYLKRDNYRKWSGRIFTRFRPENKFGILEVRPHVNFDGYWKQDGLWGDDKIKHFQNSKLIFWPESCENSSRPFTIIVPFQVSHLRVEVLSNFSIRQYSGNLL
jgi:hypothetical protein